MNHNSGSFNFLDKHHPLDLSAPTDQRTHLHANGDITIMSCGEIIHLKSYV